jgi:hypothetical protein
MKVANIVHNSSSFAGQFNTVCKAKSYALQMMKPCLEKSRASCHRFLILPVREGLLTWGPSHFSFWRPA